jgi:integrase
MMPDPGRASNYCTGRRRRGMRRAELSGLRLGDIDFDHSVAVVLSSDDRPA